MAQISASTKIASAFVTILPRSILKLYEYLKWIANFIMTIYLAIVLVSLVHMAFTAVYE